MPPEQIGHFRILDRIAAGGMGVVYRARDERLNREVALKLLPEGIAVSDDARARFSREAEAVAALNHPHICTLYDIGEHQGRPYLVMELLEGETLLTRLARGPVRSAEVAEWGAEIAEALQAAHAKGILHRDLKPSNIFITARGAAKVLDFGLAQIELAPSGETDAPTRHAGPLTTPGTTLGTLAYMSPEQARGEPTDARSDLFSLGVVLYEMASGAAPFRGRTGLDISAAILRETPPPPSALRSEVPPLLDAIVARCLEKDPDLRYQSASDLRSDLRRLKRESGSEAAARPPQSSVVIPTAAAASDSQILSGVMRRHWRWPALAALVLALAALAYWRLAPGAAPAVALQFHQLTFTGQVEDAVISPDGKFLVHVDLGPHGTSLHLLSISSGSDVEIVPPGQGCCQSPAFSPDGGQVYFLRNRALYAVPVLGGAVRSIAANACSGPAFSPDGSQIAFVGEALPDSNLVLARADGSQPRVLTTAPKSAGFVSECWGSPGLITHPPSWSPDGQWIAATMAYSAAGNGHVELISARDGQRRELGPNVGFTVEDASWLPDGKALIATASIPLGATPQVWEFSYPAGQARQLTSDLLGYSSASVSSRGELALLHSAPQFSVWTQSKPGAPARQLPGGGATQDGAAGLAWTPQDDLVSVRNLGGQPQIWSEAGDGSGARALISPAVAKAADLVVAANGQIVYDGGSPATIWRANADGTAPTALLHPAANQQAYAPAIVGSGVAYLFFDGSGVQTLQRLALDGGSPRVLVSTLIFSQGEPASPDGTRLFAWQKGPHGVHQGIVVRLDGPTPTITPVGLAFKATMGPYGWTADGRAITYIKNEGSVDNIWAYPLAGGPVYAITHFNDLRIASYAFSHDGRLAVSRGSQNSDAVVAVGLGSGK